MAKKNEACVKHYDIMRKRRQRGLTFHGGVRDEDQPRRERKPSLKRGGLTMKMDELDTDAAKIVQAVRAKMLKRLATETEEAATV